MSHMPGLIRPAGDVSPPAGLNAARAGERNCPGAGAVSWGSPVPGSSEGTIFLPAQ